MNHQPFKRINLLLSAASALMAKSNFSLAQALSMQPEYRSRGKGRGATPKARKGKHMDKVRSARTAHNKAKMS